MNEISIPRALLLREDVRGDLLNTLLHLVACDTCWTTQGLYEHGFNRTTAQKTLNALTDLKLYRRYWVETEDGDTLIHVALATTPGEFGPPVCLSRVFFAVRDGFIMIGNSIVLQSRIRQLEKEFGPFSSVTDIQGGHGLETRIREKFSQHQVDNKWFQDCQPLRDYITEVSA